MDQVSLVLAVAAESADDARAFMRELEQQRKADYDASERRIGISKEVVPRPAGGPGRPGRLHGGRRLPERAGEVRVVADEFDLWFKRRLADSTGLDLNTPPDVLPELLSSYAA